MVPAEQTHADEQANWDFFLTLPEYDRTKLDGTRFDKRAFLVIDAPGIGKHRMHGIATILQPGNAETGIESTGEGKDNVFAFSGGGIRDSGFGIRRS